MLPLLVEGEDDCSTPAASHCLIRGYEAIDGRSTNILSQSVVYTGTRLPCGGSSYIATVNALVSCPFRTGILCLVDCVNIKAFRRVITLHQATVGDAVFVGATNKSTLFACLQKVFTLMHSMVLHTFYNKTVLHLAMAILLHVHHSTVASCTRGVLHSTNTCNYSSAERPIEHNTISCLLGSSAHGCNLRRYVRCHRCTLFSMRGACWTCLVCLPVFNINTIACHCVGFRV